MVIGDCYKCDKTLYEGDVLKHFTHTDVFLCHNCNQPERSKREDLSQSDYDLSDFMNGKNRLESVQDAVL